MKKPDEGAIRDYLADHLDMIEPGLTLIRKELHLPNADGAAGFLDIFAKSANGQLIVIEIKKTNSAAREAIQELYKYAALLRQRYLIQNVEFRLVLLSVEWHELLVPFSEFFDMAPYELRAGRIALDGSGLPFSILPVEPSSRPAARKIARRHFLWRFPSKTVARAAVTELARFMNRSGLADFVLIESQSTHSDLVEHGFIYFAQQELSFDQYMSLIEVNLDADQLQEFRDSISDYTEEEDRIAEASDAVWGSRSGAPGREIGADHLEISHPEKAQHWFAPGSQLSVRIHRFGRFQDEHLADQAILAGIVGEGGESDYILRATARTDSPPQMIALRKAIKNIFFFNSDWLGSVEQLLSYAGLKSSATTIELVAFSNEDVLRAIAGAAFGYPGYVPTFRLDIVHNGKGERFIGLMEWDGATPDFDRIIAEHFAGDQFRYFITVHFGENRSFNLDIMNALGLRYAVFREASNGPERVRVQGSSIVGISKPILGSINTLIAEHATEVEKIIDMFMQHDGGFGRSIKEYLNSDMQLSERRLAAIIADEQPPKEIFYWHGEITACDNCETPFAPLRYMVDAILRRGIGLNVCALCFFEIGRGLGNGKGQAYEATNKGWRCVAGSAENSDIE